MTKRKLALFIATAIAFAPAVALAQAYTGTVDDTMRVTDNAGSGQTVNAYTYIQGAGGASGGVLTTNNTFTGTNTFSNTVTLSPASHNIAISPTGTGTVTISPAGALTVNPTTASTINNTSIGATTPLAGVFTTLAATSLDSTPIGANTASTGAFTTLTATGAFTASPANLNDVLSPTGSGVVTINPATAGTVNNVSLGATTPLAVTGTAVNATTSFSLNGNLALSPTAPTIANGGGLGTVGTIVGSAAAFDVTAGTGAASVFVITLPAAAHGWVCNGADITTASTTVTLVKQTVGTNNTTTVTMGNYNDTGALAAVGTADHLRISCMAY